MLRCSDTKNLLCFTPRFMFWNFLFLVIVSESIFSFRSQKVWCDDVGFSPDPHSFFSPLNLLDFRLSLNFKVVKLKLEIPEYQNSPRDQDGNEDQHHGTMCISSRIKIILMKRIFIGRSFRCIIFFSLKINKKKPTKNFRENQDMEEHDDVCVWWRWCLLFFIQKCWTV